MLDAKITGKNMPERWVLRISKLKQVFLRQVFDSDTTRVRFYNNRDKQ